MDADLRLPPKADGVSDLEFRRVMTPYVLLRGFVRDKAVLEVGVGSGHGAWLLKASGASRLLAMDIDAGNVERVRRLCGTGPSVSFVVGDAQEIAIAGENFDLVTCFEVIEHVARPDLLLRGLRRLLAPGGVVLLSTPNRKVRLLPFQKPWNPEHVREYSHSSFSRALRRHFPAHAIFGIFGEERSETYYRNLWRQNPLRAYSLMARRLLHPVVPNAVRSSLGNPSSSQEATEPKSAVGAPQPIEAAPTGWPFHLRDSSRHALNFIAVCGSEEAVASAADRLRRHASLGTVRTTSVLAW